MVKLCTDALVLVLTKEWISADASVRVQFSTESYETKCMHCNHYMYLKWLAS